MGDYAEQLVKNCMVVQAIVPVDMVAGALNSVGISLKHWDHMTIVAQTGAIAGGTCAITLAQDTSVAWTSGDTIALGFTTVYTNEAAVASSVLLPVTVVSTDNLAVANAMYVIEVDADSLSQAMGAVSGLPFDCVRIQLSAPAANDLVAVACILSKGRYTGAPASMKDVFLD